MKRILALLVLSVAICAPGSAAQEEHAEKSEAAEGAATHHEEESTFHIVARWVNFAILFGGLIYLLRKPMGDFFATRRNDISSGLQRAQDAQASAKARMDEIEQRLAHLSADMAALKTEAEKESLVEREKILMEAKREVERVVEQSRQEIERVARTVEREIKETIADQVIDRAGNTLRSEMTQDDQKRVVVRFIKKL
jgi:F-type H+-transporting ATPase subunit b